MSQRKYRLDVCPECKVKEEESSKKQLFQCRYCERWFCKRHLEPRLAVIRDFKTLMKDTSWRNIIEKETRRKNGHPDFAYTRERLHELKTEKAIVGAKITSLLDKSKAYGKPFSDKARKKNELYFVKEERPHPPELPSSKPKSSKKVRTAILAVSLVTVIVIAFLFLNGIVGIPSSPTVKDTITSRVITQGKISVFEDQECRKPVQTIDWGKVESNHQYSRTVYVRNDNQEEWLDWGKRDIVWQRENVNPSSVYISIKVSYGDRRIKPNEVRKATITLTVLGLLEDSDKLNPNADITQFTFDLILKGQDLSLLTYVRVFALREANNITVVYKDELKETISVIVEVGIWKSIDGNQVFEAVWNTTRYAPEFTTTWLNADVYTSYQLIVTLNHERYGKDEYRNYLPGQLP